MPVFGVLFAPNGDSAFNDELEVVEFVGDVFDVELLLWLFDELFEDVELLPDDGATVVVVVPTVLLMLDGPALLVPEALVAVELKVYAVPLVSPAMVHVVAGTVTVHVAPPGVAVTM
ncbi:MAG: hypothetical protein RLZ18_951 [Actinomycetota bacterium]|jgi:hypothetical protein